jgi:YHS domain-containing protein
VPILALLLFSAVSLGQAEEKTLSQRGAMEVVEIGNKICPISGDKVSPKAFYVYQGKKYNFCCAACIKKFKKNPEKYVAETEK